MKTIYLVLALGLAITISGCASVKTDAQVADSTQATVRKPASDPQVPSGGFAPEVHQKCADSVWKAIQEFQIQDLKLTGAERRKFIFDWGEDRMSLTPQYQRDLQAVKLMCARAYIMAAPIAPASE